MTRHHICPDFHNECKQQWECAGLSTCTYHPLDSDSRRRQHTRCVQVDHNVSQLSLDVTMVHPSQGGTAVCIYERQSQISEINVFFFFSYCTLDTKLSRQKDHHVFWQNQRSDLDRWGRKHSLLWPWRGRWLQVSDLSGQSSLPSHALRRSPICYLRRNCREVREMQCVTTGNKSGLTLKWFWILLKQICS